MSHTREKEQTIETVDVEVGMLVHERVHGFVVMNRVAWADELIRPADVVDDLPIVSGPSESGEVRFDCLRTCQQSYHRASRNTEGSTHIGLSGVDLVR